MDLILMGNRDARRPGLRVMRPVDSAGAPAGPEIPARDIPAEQVLKMTGS
jgi:hypothetical protein